MNRYCPLCRGIMVDDLDFPDRAVYRCVRCHRRFTFSMFTKLQNLGKAPAPHVRIKPHRINPLLVFSVVFFISLLVFALVALL